MKDLQCLPIEGQYATGLRFKGMTASNQLGWG